MRNLFVGAALASCLVAAAPAAAESILEREGENVWSGTYVDEGFKPTYDRNVTLTVRVFPEGVDHTVRTSCFGGGGEQIEFAFVGAKNFTFLRGCDGSMGFLQRLVYKDKLEKVGGYPPDLLEYMKQIGSTFSPIFD